VQSPFQKSRFFVYVNSILKFDFWQLTVPKCKV